MQMFRIDFRYWLSLCVICSAALLLCGRQLHAKPDSKNLNDYQQSLVSIKKIFLEESYDGKAEADGLLKADIQTDVEAKLRQAGIYVSTTGISAPTKDDKRGFKDYQPLLFVKIALSEASDNTYAYLIRIDMNQMCSILRSNEFGLYTTWQTISHGTIGKDKAVQIRELIKNSMEVFCHDYLTANPKSSVPGKNKEADCLSNIEMLSLAVSHYVADHDEVFPSKNSLKSSTMPYMKTEMPPGEAESAYHCPSVAPDANSYFLNPYLEGQTLMKVAVLAKTIMLYEGTSQHVIFRHNNKAAITLCNGRGFMMTEAQVKKLRWKPGN